MNIDVNKVIVNLIPEAKPLENFEVVYFGEDYEVINWKLDTEVPSKEKIAEKWEEILPQIKEEQEKEILEELAELTLEEKVIKLEKTVTEQAKVIEMLISSDLENAL